eukprot:7804890-Pyramimonas_sp.AAC.1
MYLLCWLAQRLILQEPIIVQENARQFPESILREYLGHLYQIEVVRMHSEHYGIPSTRERKWVIMRHKSKTSWQFVGTPISLESVSYTHLTLPTILLV